MSHHRRIRTAVAAGALVLALGSAPLTIALATAAPVHAAPVNPSFPDPGGGQQPQPKKDERIDKAEKLGGNIITRMIDSMADTLKCTLNIGLPTVKCG
ncbi:hypothetical protein [Nocardia sp. NPDC051981]|uniref:hypothetical protein n=1 Tax=Nocardia sp. NPDC051981 TaxID=3155417 RepID=UPI003449DE2A